MATKSNNDSSYGSNNYGSDSSSKDSSSKDSNKEELDARFADAPKGTVEGLSDTGIKVLEDKGDGLVVVEDRDGRVSVFPKDAEPANMSAEQRQKAVDLAIEHSPVDKELSPGHSDYDPDKSPVVVPDEPKNLRVVNKDLGVDSDNKSNK